MSFVESQLAVQLMDRRIAQLRGIVEEFPEEMVWVRPRSGVSSLGNLICHVSGSLRDWLENGLAQGSWRRDRDSEFSREGGMDRQALIQHLADTRAHCDPILAAIDQDTWQQPRSFRGGSHTVRSIVLHQLDHLAYHSGQAALLRRIVADLEPAP